MWRHISIPSISGIMTSLTITSVASFVSSFSSASFPLPAVYTLYHCSSASRISFCNSMLSSTISTVWRLFFVWGRSGSNPSLSGWLSVSRSFSVALFRGSERMNEHPLDGRFSTDRVPWWDSASDLEKASPIPVPGICFYHPVFDRRFGISFPFVLRESGDRRC